jgi:hypothetical protein
MREYLKNTLGFSVGIMLWSSDAYDISMSRKYSTNIFSDNEPLFFKAMNHHS